MALTTDTKSLIANVKPSYIYVKDIDGIDFENKYVNRDPDFASPKRELRKSVLKTLSSAESPSEVPPVEVYVGDGGKIHLLDGDHRVSNALSKIEDIDDESDPWAKIRVYKFVGPKRKAQLRAQTANIEESRGNLDTGELIGVVERCQSWGLSNDEIEKEIGRGSKKLVSKIDKIINASPEVLEAAKAGEIDLWEGMRIAQKPLEEQSEVLETLIAEKSKGDTKAARKKADVGIKRRKLLKLPEVEAYLWPHWDNWQRMMEGTLAKEEWVMGFVGSLIRVLGFVPNDGERQEQDDEPMDTETIVGELNPHYNLWRDIKDNPPKKRAKRGEKEKA